MAPNRRAEGAAGIVAEEVHLAAGGIDLGMRGERPAQAVVIGLIAQRPQRARFDLGWCVAFLQRQQATAVPDDIGVRSAGIVAGRGRRIRQFLAESPEQRASGIVLGQEFRRPHPAIAIAGAAVLEMKRMQHPVADEPVRAGVELWVGPVAIQRAVQLPRQRADDLQERRVALHRDRRQIVQRALGFGWCGFDR